MRMISRYICCIGNLRVFLTQSPRRKNMRSIHCDVRVRFAPSPTGNLHLGGLRTALYNFLYARKMNGKFILRIEDTDQTRLVPGAAQSLIDDLLWSGLQIDEGPGFGGGFGPYIQSERLQIYKEAADHLLSNGSAYRCFCTEHRLELIRKDALRNRQVPRYDNNCRHLSEEEQYELLERKVKYCVRFKLSDHKEPLNDLIYGKVWHNVSDNEGDPVIMKSDNFPTYHFANVIDDHFMEISHVLRGVEWQISTTKHLLLYKALGWKPPEYGHLPLLINADGTKLSKRQGDISIKQLRENGYFPEVLINYVASAGGGFDKTNLSQALILSSVEGLVQKFDLKKVNSHPSRLNPDLLNEFNRLKIIQLCKDCKKGDQLVTNVKALIKTAYPQHALDLDEDHILRILKWSATRLTFLKDLTSANMSFLWVKPNLMKIDLQDITEEQINQLLINLETSPFSKDNLNAILKDFSKQEIIKFSTLMKILRSTLSGLKEGPGVAEMMEILGKNIVMERLKELQSVRISQKKCNEVTSLDC